MHKLMFCLRRRADLSHEAFLDYWFHQHAPLVRQYAKDIGLVKYAQSHGLAHPLDKSLRESRGGPAAYDGIAELFYKSPTALQDAMTEPAAREAGRILLEDERRFIDLAQSPLFICEQRTIIEADG